MKHDLSSKQVLWLGFEVKAIDTMTLALPEWPALFKKFKCHKTGKGVGTIAVECCCLFSTALRIPIALAFGRANTSDHKLIRKLVKHLKKGDLLLIDGGFYSFMFFKIIKKICPFIIPMDKSGSPRVITTLAKGDYLCEIKDSKTKQTMTVRVIYAYRRGFRRRRLVTSLLDPVNYPAEAIANLYHMRWTIETFYNEFKNTMQGNKWHCQTPHTFEVELVMKMILACLIRFAMAKAAKAKGLLPRALSFSRALTETRVFLKQLISQGCQVQWPTAYLQYALECGRYLIKEKPGRSFSRDKQIYRKKARGLERGKVGRPRTVIHPPLPPEQEFITTEKGITYLLS